LCCAEPVERTSSVPMSEAPAPPKKTAAKVPDSRPAMETDDHKAMNKDGLQSGQFGFLMAYHYFRVTTCLENLEMSGNLEHVREMSGMLLTVTEMSRKKSCHGKVSQNCSLLDEY